MHYNINLVRATRIKEKKGERKRLTNLVFLLCALGVLLVSSLYTAFEILRMERVLTDEQDKVARIQEEYKRYKASKTIINKADIELLDKLQHERIFWTKKLVAMAQYLPENYWITDFAYDKRDFNVDGYGYITKEQEQLLTMDDYLNELRKDTTFNDVFRNTYLNLTERKDERTRERITFKYSSISAK